MYIKSLRLVDFRNYSNQKIEFDKGINLIFGDNAQGKTNILEAIYICSIGKSQRNIRDEDLVLFGQGGYFIEIDLIKEKRSYKIEIGFNKQKGKAVRIGGVGLKSIGELLGKLVVVMFFPDDLKMIKEGPSYRRRFLDILICQLHSSYLYDLQSYHKILNQRNNLLKQIKITPDIENTLDVWDEKLAQVGSKIIQKRICFVKKIIEKVLVIHKNLALNEELKVKYDCSFIDKADENLSNNDIYEHFYKALQKSREKDIKRGFTNEGPHRDDLKFFINNLDVEKFGSQGQQRTVVLSLKLAELNILEEEIEDKPILLLDDVFSELDESRREYLKQYIKEFQVLITSTDKSEIVKENDSIRTLKVVNGSVCEE